jgi:hypothetical protein
LCPEFETEISGCPGFQIPGFLGGCPGFFLR